RVAQRDPHFGVFAFGADECTDGRSQAIQGRKRPIGEDAGQKAAGLSPFVGLEPEQDRLLVRKILVERSDADTGLLGDAGGGEATGALAGQNATGRHQYRCDEVPGPFLLGLLSRGNARRCRTGHGRPREREWKMRPISRNLRAGARRVTAPSSRAPPDAREATVAVAGQNATCRRQTFRGGTPGASLL